MFLILADLYILLFDFVCLISLIFLLLKGSTKFIMNLLKMSLYIVQFIVFKNCAQQRNSFLVLLCPSDLQMLFTMQFTTSLSFLTLLFWF